MDDIHDNIGNALQWLEQAGEAMHPEAECPPLPGIEKLREATRLLEEVQGMYPAIVDDREPIAPGDYRYFYPNNTGDPLADN